jgi:hypothetical protein
LDQTIPKGVVAAIEEGILEIYQQAVRGKRAKGVMGVEKELNKEIIRTQASRNILKLSKQLIHDQLSNAGSDRIMATQNKIIQEIITCS